MIFKFTQNKLTGASILVDTVKFEADIFFLSKWCTHDYKQTFTINELKQKEKKPDKTWLIQRLAPKSLS